jgi:hypothetical protein
MEVVLLWPEPCEEPVPHKATSTCTTIICPEARQRLAAGCARHTATLQLLCTNRQHTRYSHMSGGETDMHHMLVMLPNSHSLNAGCIMHACMHACMMHNTDNLLAT